MFSSDRSCFEAFTENMAGETQLLELRRHYHCAAYNCAIAVISCSFSEPKFYQGFLFSEKPEKVLTALCKYLHRNTFLLVLTFMFISPLQSQFILENIIDIGRIYNFPIEIEVCVYYKHTYQWHRWLYDVFIYLIILLGATGKEEEVLHDSERSERGDRRYLLPIMSQTTLSTLGTNSRLSFYGISRFIYWYYSHSKSRGWKIKGFICDDMKQVLQLWILHRRVLLVLVDDFVVMVSTETPVYLSSQSYMADSSLSEEMSQFDFSTGVQSFSYNSQNPEGPRRSVAKRVSDDYVTLLSFTALDLGGCLSKLQKRP